MKGEDWFNDKRLKVEENFWIKQILLCAIKVVENPFEELQPILTCRQAYKKLKEKYFKIKIKQLKKKKEKIVISHTRV